MWKICMQSAKKWLEMVLKWSFLNYGSIFNASDVTILEELYFLKLFPTYILLRFDQMDPNLHLHSCYRKCTMDYRHLWFSNNPCNISFSFWLSNPHCLPRIWTFGFDIFWPVYLWSIWWWLPIRLELHELQPRINN